MVVVWRSRNFGALNILREFAFVFLVKVGKKKSKDNKTDLNYKDSVRTAQ